MNAHGRRLKRARLREGLSLRQAAAKAGIGFNSVTRIERGENAWFDHVVALASIYGLSLDALVIPPACAACDDLPPAGFTCNRCGSAGAES